MNKIKDRKAYYPDSIERLQKLEKDKGYERELKYCKNQRTVFVDEMKGDQRLEHIIFRNGALFVPKNEQMLQKLLSLYHPDKDKLYYEWKPVAVAENQLIKTSNKSQNIIISNNFPTDAAVAQSAARRAREAGLDDEAKAMNERALAGRERTLGADHPDTLMTVGNLAIVLAKQGKLDEAQAMFEREKAGKERALGADHPNTLDTVNNLANVLKEQGKLDEAKALHERYSVRADNQ